MADQGSTSDEPRPGLAVAGDNPGGLPQDVTDPVRASGILALELRLVQDARERPPAEVHPDSLSRPIGTEPGMH